MPVHKFYRMMDAVDDRRIALQSIVAREVTDLLGGKLDVLFFDVTRCRLPRTRRTSSARRDTVKMVSTTVCRWYWR